MNTTDDLEPELNAVQRDNVVVRGNLVLHAAHRDVVWMLDGDTAMRVLGSLRVESMAQVWSQNVDPLTSDAYRGWLLWNVDAIVAARWEPDREATRAVLIEYLRARGASPDDAESAADAVLPHREDLCETLAGTDGGDVADDVDEDTANEHDRHHDVRGEDGI